MDGLTGGLMGIGVIAGGIVILLIVFGVMLARLYRRASKEIAFVRTGSAAKRS